MTRCTHFLMLPADKVLDDESLVGAGTPVTTIANKQDLEVSSF